MSLAVAVPCGIAAALAYGAATAVQHSAANTGTGQADARGLLRLLRNPRWLASVGGDAVGLLLQIIALATGPVVLIQPLLVLALPVSLLVGWSFGGARPRGSELTACVAILGGLAVFFVLVGDPGTGRALDTTPALVTIVVALAAGGLAVLGVHGRATSLRAGVYGAVAGACFGIVGVLLNALATTWSDLGPHAAVTATALLPLVGVIAVGGVGIVLTQVSFQVGALAASFPANESAAPFVAVLLGGLLLHERVPSSPPVLVAYLLCLLAVVVGAIRLAAGRDDDGASVRDIPSARRSP